ncbi:helix-turn-helix domain-containing protein [Flavobacterium chungangense]|uniref:Uncharacterized protein n=1 Tax=Flavobacterium chungangense TaxID=554283 RepID=A0A6V6YY43_9FLAO|nr:hypothetical protein [Flavobacterium chungangense]CAD0004410.1 hypothetical protein FLACHUCJ7_01847 [Flavobacterium chungangense]
MDFRYHPIIENLKISENGTEIYYNDVLLKPFENDKSRKNPTLKVNFLNKAHSVAKLVCEAWNGLREHSGQRVSKINQLSDNHYSNLEWKEGASSGVGNWKQKLKHEDIPEIIALLQAGKSKTQIDRKFNVDGVTILRNIEKHDKENQ